MVEDENKPPNGAVQPDNANDLPGGTLNTAGGRPRNATLLDALNSVRLRDFTEVHKKPCVRDALLPGIGAGFAVGGVRAIMGGMSDTVALPMKSDRMNSSDFYGMYLGSR